MPFLPLGATQGLKSGTYKYQSENGSKERHIGKTTTTTHTHTHKEVTIAGMKPPLKNYDSETNLT